MLKILGKKVVCERYLAIRGVEREVRELALVVNDLILLADESVSVGHLDGAVRGEAQALPQAGPALQFLISLHQLAEIFIFEICDVAELEFGVDEVEFLIDAGGEGD